MADETQMSGDATGAHAADDGVATEREPAWFAKYRDLVDKRFEGLASKLREPAPAQRDTSGAAKSNGDTEKKTAEYLSRDEAEAIFELGTSLGKLPEKARARIEQMGRDGASYRDRLQAARLLIDFAEADPANGSGTGASPPPGKASNAAPTKTITHPRTQAEFVALRARARTDPVAKREWDSVMSDPTFDPSQLESR